MTSPKPKFKNIAVTGGAGYVGSALVPYLIKLGYEVKVIDLFLYGDHGLKSVEKSPFLKQVKADIRDTHRLRKELAGMDAVIHLACISNDPSFELNPRLGKSINYDAFPGLVQAVRENGVKRFIYASSSSVYGLKEEKDVREEALCQPLTDYSKYKMLCEEYLKSVRLEEACEYVILRPATVCGFAPRMRLDLTVNILTIHALVRKEIIVYGGDQLRPNIHMSDVIEVYRILLEASREKMNGETFNAGYENDSVMHLAEMVKRQVDDPTVTIRVEPTDDHRSYHINSDKIKRVLGFVPRYTIPDAVASICEAYRQGRMPNPLTDPCYYNIQTMKKANLSEEPVLMEA